jgi:hypothetical protein
MKDWKESMNREICRTGRRRPMKRRIRSGGRRDTWGLNQHWNQERVTWKSPIKRKKKRHGTQLKPENGRIKSHIIFMIVSDREFGEMTKDWLEALERIPKTERNRQERPADSQNTGVPGDRPMAGGDERLCTISGGYTEERSLGRSHKMGKGRGEDMEGVQTLPEEIKVISQPTSVKDVKGRDKGSPHLHVNPADIQRDASPGGSRKDVGTIGEPLEQNRRTIDTLEPRE